MKESGWMGVVEVCSLVMALSALLTAMINLVKLCEILRHVAVVREGVERLELNGNGNKGDGNGRDK